MNKDQLETHRFSDEDVLNDLRNQAGDGEAIKWFLTFARRYLSRILPVKNPHDFEDIFQESSLDLVKKHHQYQSRQNASLLTYFAKIAKHKSIDFFRKNRKYQNHSPLDLQKVHPTHYASNHGEADLITNSDIQWLKKFVAKVVGNPAQTEVLLYKKMGYTHEEICQMEGIPYRDADSCKSAHYKSKKKLTQFILENPDSDFTQFLNRF